MSASRGQAPAGRVPPLDLVVAPEEAGLRLDHFLRQRLPGISRGSVMRLLEQRQVLLDGRPLPKGTRLVSGQRVLVASGAASEHPLPQPELPLVVLEVHPDLVAIDKPAGRACHPLLPGETETVANALAARHPECVSASPHPREGGLVHRLDWSTSGVLLAARDRTSYGRLRGLFSASRVEKLYLALAGGRIGEPGRIESGLRAAPGDRTRVQVLSPTDKSGRLARTEYWPLKELAAHTLLRVRCHTGQRHQIRVHLAHLGHPLAGDERYGGQGLLGCEGAFLHAWKVALPDGRTFVAPLPAERARLLESLGASRPDGA